jgi:hypothetical protein
MSEAAEPTRLTPELLERENRRTDRLLAFLLTLLAFFLASFPIVDSRFWQSLRTGQLIALGQFDFQSDPFCYTTAGAYWVHPGWLADYMFYSAYETYGAAGLVLLRGLVMVLLALLLLSYGRPRGGVLILLTVLLATMALATRLWLRPELFSILFCALTIYLLQRPAEPQPKGLLAPLLRLTSGRYYVFLPLLFMLWVNLDDWFLLGPLIVLLWWLGSWLPLGAPAPGAPVAPGAVSPAERRGLLVVLLVGLAACLANPYHVHVFRLPPELYAKALWFIDAQIASRNIIVSPFSPERFTAGFGFLRPLGLTWCDWAYYGLVALGAVSFLVNQNYRRGERLAVWLGFLVLSALATRNIGFFAVVGGSLTVLNLRDWRSLIPAPAAARGEGGQSRAALPAATRWNVAKAMTMRFALLLLLLVLLFLMVAPDNNIIFAEYDLGGGQGRLTRRERLMAVSLGEPVLGLLNPRGALGWSAFADPSLKAVAEWRGGPAAQGLGQAFYMNFAEPAGYEAWFNPAGKSFIDFRYDLHGQTVEEFWDAYEALRASSQPDAPARSEELLRRWQGVFRKYDISQLVVPNRPAPRESAAARAQAGAVSWPDLIAALRDPAGNPQFVPLDFLDGSHYVFAWTGSPHFAQLSKRRLDATEQVFRQTSAAPPPSAPIASGDLTPLGVKLEGALSRRPPPLDAAGQLLMDYTRARQQSQNYGGGLFLADLILHAAALAAGGGAPSGVRQPLPPFAVVGEQAAPAQLFLALRKARAALAAAPFRAEWSGRLVRADAYSLLLACYDSLGQMERALVPANQPMLLREFQSLCAARQDVALNPNNPEALFTMAGRYSRRRLGTGADSAELVLHFLNLYLALLKSQAPIASEQLEANFRSAVLKTLNVRYDDLQRLVQARQEQYRQMAPARGTGPLAWRSLRRAQTALSLGLPLQAEADLRDALNATDPDVLREAIGLSAYLYYEMGMLPELLTALKSAAAPAALGPRAYHRLAGMALAAAGDSLAAAQHLGLLADSLQDEVALALLYAGQRQVLGGAAGPLGNALTALRQLLYDNPVTVQQAADYRIMQGLLLIEGGQPEAAAQLFRKAVLDLAPDCSLAKVAARYYYLITHQSLGTEVASHER